MSKIKVEDLKPAPLPENPLAGLLKDRERLDFILKNCTIEYDRFYKTSLENRKEIDEVMQTEELI